VQVISEGRRWRRLLGQNIQFRRLFLAHSISRAGDAFNTVALLVLIFDLTGSGVGVAGIVALEIVPVLLLGPLVGLTVDRYPHRSLMMVADVARAVLALLVAIGGSVPVAYGVAFGLSAFTQLFNPAASSTLPDVVEADELVEANAALWTVAVVAQTVLAPLAGLLVATDGAGWAFCLNAASYLASAAILGGLRAGREPGSVHFKVVFPFPAPESKEPPLCRRHRGGPCTSSVRADGRVRAAAPRGNWSHRRQLSRWAGADLGTPLRVNRVSLPALGSRQAECFWRIRNGTPAIADDLSLETLDGPGCGYRRVRVPGGAQLIMLRRDG
jgi:MFS family permease